MNVRLVKKLKRTPGGPAFEANHITGPTRRQSHTTVEPAVVYDFTDLCQKHVERLADVPDADELAVTVGPDLWLYVRLRHDAAAKSHLRRLREAQTALRDARHFPSEADLAEHRRSGGNDPVADAGRDRGQDAEIGRRFVHGHPAGDVDEHIVANQVETGALLEHRQEQ